MMNMILEAFQSMWVLQKLFGLVMASGYGQTFETAHSTNMLEKRYPEPSEIYNFEDQNYETSQE